MDVLFVCRHGRTTNAFTAASFSVLCVALLCTCSAPRSTPSESARTATSKPEAPALGDPAAKAEGAPVATPTLQAATAPNGETKTFDEDMIDTAPAGFSFAKTGPGKPARWIVRKVDDAPSSPNVLAQLDEDATSDRFPLAIANEPALGDVRVHVRCKMVSGRVDQVCGLVARYRDENNYLITRANALESNIRLYTVRNGKRRPLASRDRRVTPQTRHDLRFDNRGDH